jgi:hypothetical protein
MISRMAPAILIGVYLLAALAEILGIKLTVSLFIRDNLKSCGNPVRRPRPRRLRWK